LGAMAEENFQVGGVELDEGDERGWTGMRIEGKLWCLL
jgi:hypothetical protein